MITMGPDNRADTIIGRALKMFIINPGNKCPEANSLSKCLSPKGEFEVCSEANFRVVKDSFQRAKGGLGNKPSKADPPCNR
jgi:hypothetical protein